MCQICETMVPFALCLDAPYTSSRSSTHVRPLSPAFVNAAIILPATVPSFHWRGRKYVFVGWWQKGHTVIANKLGSSNCVEFNDWSDVEVVGLNVDTVAAFVGGKFDRKVIIM